MSLEKIFLPQSVLYCILKERAFKTEKQNNTWPTIIFLAQ